MENTKTPLNTANSARSILSQVVAASVQNLLLLDLGMAISFSTMVIPSLMGASGTLSFTKEQASWFGSVFFIMQPIGSLLSGMLLEPLGRKKALLIVNIPHIVAWLMMYFAEDIITVFCAMGLLGLGTGFMEAPIITYVGEISHPKIRGTLTSYAQVFAVTGMFCAYLLGSVLEWRMAAACALIIPIITLMCAVMIPESPIWLLTKGHKDAALQALCWVRGWAQPSDVQEEFEELLLYQKENSQCKACTDNAQTECDHKPKGFVEHLKELYEDLTRKEMLRPLFVMLLMFFFLETTGSYAMRPNLVNIYKAYGLNIDSHLAVVLTGLLGIMGVIVLMIVIKFTGKRVLNLGSLLSCAICTFLLGLYARTALPLDANSYTNYNTPRSSHSWFPTLLFGVNQFTSSIGINVIAWIMLSEVFPLRKRGAACGLIAAFAYIANSILAKTHMNLEEILGMHGVMWFYTTCSALGFLCMYFLMPETEGKSIQNIQKEFSGEYMPIFATDKITRKYLMKNRYSQTTIPAHYTNPECTLEVFTVEKVAQ